MKKILLFLSLSLFLFSCSNDDSDDDVKKNIVGYWKFENVSPVEVITDSEANTEKVKDFIRKKTGNVPWEFKKDGTGLDYDGSHIEKFRYTVDGNKLTIFELDKEGNDIPDEDALHEYEFYVKENTLSIIQDWTYASNVRNAVPDADITKVIVSVNYERR